MKHKIVFLYIAFSLFGFGQLMSVCGQIPNKVGALNKESFIKAVDFLNCQTIELSLKDDSNLFNFKQSCACGQANYTKMNAFLVSTKLDANVALSNEIESIKNLYNEKLNKTEALNLLTEGVFSDNIKYQKISAFVTKRSGSPGFAEFKKRLKSEISNILTENSTQVASSSPKTESNSNIDKTSIEDRISELEIKIDAKKEEESTLGGFMIYIILFLVLLIAVAWFSSLKNRNDKGLSNEVKKLINEKIELASFNRSVSSNTSKNNVGSFELTDAIKRIELLETQIAKMKSQLDILSTIPIQKLQTPQTPITGVNRAEEKSEIFFLSSPNADGSFDESSSSLNYKEGATIYRFTKIGNNKANFQIDNKEASVKLALQYRDRRIDPVCEATNAFNQGKNISTVQQGEAELIGGKWVVYKKAKIKYEN